MFKLYLALAFLVSMAACEKQHHSSYYDRKIISKPFSKIMKAVKTKAWFKCPRPFFLKGLKRGPSGDYLNSLVKAQCAKPFDQFKGDLKCKRANWWRSFDRQGWSKCQKNYYMAGFFKNHCNKLYCIEEAYCCKSHYDHGYAHCYNENIGLSFDKKNTWAKCKRNGYFMTGIYRSRCHKLYCMESLKCCNPQTTYPAVHKIVYTAYNANWWSSFDRKGWSKCKKGYFMSGIYRNKCDLLYCIEQVQCKKPTTQKKGDV